MTAVRVEPVAPGRLRAFEAVPRQLHKRTAHWTPQLAGEESRLLDSGRNPALQGYRVGCWLAWRGSRLVGRIAAFAPPPPSESGYFGFFECDRQGETAEMLFQWMEQWLVSQGRHEIWGPLPGNPRDQLGLVIDGFDRPGTVLTPWNPPHYKTVLEENGYQAAVFLRSYGWYPDLADPDGLLDREEVVRRRGRVRLRPFNRGQLDREALLAAEIINAAFAGVWGFTPVRSEEALFEARQLLPILDPRLCLVAEDENGPLGVALTIPDANWLLRRMRGRLLPAGWLAYARWRRRIPWARFMALAVVPGRRAGGAALRLVIGTHRGLLAGGYQFAELAQVFDDNRPMRSVIERIGCPVIRRFAVYHKDLAR